jgi:hypothetical protein
LRDYDVLMPIEKADLVLNLESLGARTRRRRDGSLHTVDFSSVPQAASDELIPLLIAASRLNVLLLPHAPITDAAATSLAKLAELTELDLRETRITDAGLAQLNSLTKLKILQLTGAAVTREGVKSLRQALLNCRIVFSV